MLPTVLALVVGYLLGTIPSAALVGRRTGHDPTAEGSGNPGATNVYRTAGRGAGAAVLALDVAKGALAAAVGLALDDHRLAVLAGAAAVAGHVAPLGRQGGKGVATMLGMAAVCYPGLTVVLVAVFAVVVALTRLASVGSLVVALLLPVGVALGGHGGCEILATTAVSLVVIACHHDNIRRLLRHEEAPVRPREAP